MYKNLSPENKKYVDSISPSEYNLLVEATISYGQTGYGVKHASWDWLDERMTEVIDMYDYYKKKGIRFTPGYEANQLSDLAIIARRAQKDPKRKLDATDYDNVLNNQKEGFFGGLDVDDSVNALSNLDPNRYASSKDWWTRLKQSLGFEFTDEQKEQVKVIEEEEKSAREEDEREIQEQRDYFQKQSEALRKSREDADKAYEQQSRDLQSLQTDVASQREEAKRKYGITEDLYDQALQVSRDFSSAPSVVDAEIQKTLGDNLSKQLEAQSRNRSRFANLGRNDPVNDFNQNLGVIAQQRSAQKLAEAQSRSSQLQKALSDTATGKRTIEQQKSADALNYLKLQQGLINSQGTISQNQIGNRQNAIHENIDLKAKQQKYEIEKRAYDEIQLQIQLEPHNQELRRLSAIQARNLNLAKAAIHAGAGIGAAFAGAPQVGLALGGQAFSDLGSAIQSHQLSQSGGLTPGLFGRYGAEAGIPQSAYYQQPTRQGSTPNYLKLLTSGIQEYQNNAQTASFAGSTSSGPAPSASQVPPSFTAPPIPAAQSAGLGKQLQAALDESRVDPSKNQQLKVG